MVDAVISLVVGKYLKYFLYILKHKWHVCLRCFARGLIWQGLVHDLSKFLPSEFIPYANYYYGCAKDRQAWEVRFHAAWLRHIHRNRHHWQHWMLVTDQMGASMLEMPLRYTREMICDWDGVCRHMDNGISVQDWYRTNACNMRLHLRTAKFIREDLYGK